MENLCLRLQTGHSGTPSLIGRSNGMNEPGSSDSNQRARFLMNGLFLYYAQRNSLRVCLYTCLTRRMKTQNHSTKYSRYTQAVLEYNSQQQVAVI